MDGDLRIPGEAQEVTADWLTSILSYTVDPASVRIQHNAHEGKGFLSNLLRVTCAERNSTKESHLIIKLLPQDDSIRQVVVGQGLDKAEILTYKQVLPVLISEVPELANYICAIIFGKFQETENQYRSVLVLQDLKPLHYFTLDFGEVVTAGQLSDGIDFLAKLHLAGALTEEKAGKKLNQLFEFLQNDIFSVSETFKPWMVENYPEVVKMLSDSDLSPEVKEAYADLGDTLNSVMEHVVQNLALFPSLTHTDLWTNNILYNTDSEKHTKVIDWQGLSYRDVNMDLGIFVTSSLPAEKLTVEGVKTLVKEYYDLYTKLCNDRKVPNLVCRDWSEFYDFFKTYGLAFALIWFVLSQTAFRGKNDERLIRTYEYFYDVGVVSFVKSIKI